MAGSLPAPRVLVSRATPAVHVMLSQVAAWRWAIGFALLMTLTLEIPYRLAASHASDGLYFVGMFWAPHDAAQYLSAMWQGANSSGWLIVDRFTQEPHRPVLMYPFYVGLGKLAALADVKFENAFLLASAAGRFFLCLALYAFAALGSRERGPRRLATVLLAFSTGLASVMAVLQMATGLPLPNASRELNDPEVNTYLTFFTAPHLMIGLGLLLIAVRVYAGCWDEAGWRRRAGLAAIVVLLGVINPFPLVPLCVVVGAHALLMTILRRRLDLGGWSGAVAVGAASLPFMVYSYVTFTLDPFWGATYGAQNQTLSPAVSDLIMSLGLLVPLAFLGLRRFMAPLTPEKTLVLLWLVLSVTLMYAPIGIQRRFGLGLHPTLALIATFGLLRCWRVLAKMPPRLRLVRPFVLAASGQALFGSSVYLYVVGVTIAMSPTTPGNIVGTDAGADWPSYQRAAIHAAGSWLAEQAEPESVVMATSSTGNYLAGAMPGRVYAGHWVATLNFDEKKRQADWFFSGPLTRERRTFLEASGADYIVVDRAERRLGATGFDDPALTLVYDHAGTLVYQVDRTAMRGATARK